MQLDDEARSVEAAYFAELRTACLENDPKAAIDSLISWLGVFCEGAQSGTVQEIARELVDDELALEITSLREALDFDPIDWSGISLLRAVDRARRKFHDGGTLQE
jgi:hypothetical protein